MGPMQGGGLNREPNVVPMIDILLVLLISAILGLLPGWKAEVVLPAPVESKGPTTDGPSIILSVAPGPVYTINGTPIARDRLIADLTKIYEGRPDKILFIDAARSLPYQDVFWLYGAVKGAGVEVTAIVPKETRREITSPGLR